MDRDSQDQPTPDPPTGPAEQGRTVHPDDWLVRHAGGGRFVAPQTLDGWSFDPWLALVHSEAGAAERVSNGVDLVAVAMGQAVTEWDAQHMATGTKPDWRGWPGYLGRAIGRWTESEGGDAARDARVHLAAVYDEWVDVGRPDYDPEPMAELTDDQRSRFEAAAERAMAARRAAAATDPLEQACADAGVDPAGPLGDVVAFRDGPSYLAQLIDRVEIDARGEDVNPADALMLVGAVRALLR